MAAQHGFDEMGTGERLLQLPPVGGRRQCSDVLAQAHFASWHHDKDPFVQVDMGDASRERDRRFGEVSDPLGRV